MRLEVWLSVWLGVVAAELAFVLVRWRLPSRLCLDFSCLRCPACLLWAVGRLAGVPPLWGVVLVVSLSLSLLERSPWLLLPGLERSLRRGR